MIFTHARIALFYLSFAVPALLAGSAWVREVFRGWDQ